MSVLNKYPLVSIVIPVYNGSNYMQEAIDSALNQTYPNIEVIVVNDGSKDDGKTDSIAKSYGDKIRYYEKSNGGSSSAINYGISQMRGEWFSWLSHDDIYTPDKVEKEIEYLQATGISEEELKTSIVFSGSMLIDASGNVLRRFSNRKAKKMEAVVNSIPGNEYLIANSRRFNFHGCSCLINKSLFDIAGMMDENLRVFNDVEWWFRIYSSGATLHYVPQKLVVGRIHAAQVGRSIGYSSDHPESIMLWSKRFEWLKNNHPNNAQLFIMVGRDAYLSSRTDTGNEAFRYAKLVDPKGSLMLFAKKTSCICYAKIRFLAKKIYVKLRMSS